MKTNRSIKLFTVALGLAAFSTAGGAEKDKTADVALPAAQEMKAATGTAVNHESNASANHAAAAEADVSSARWIDIKDCTYDTRVQFFDGLKRLQARVDVQIGELTAKRAAMKGTTDTKAWDFAMKEMGDARSNLKSVGAELSQASAETWEQQKDSVGRAWLRTQEAYDKVKASTTN